MSVIKTLDEHLTNMIAAGEVVERPMGVVKELVENSIDAKASSIVVRVVSGGLESIEVKDDGIGMDQGDAVRAFNRHATSKISKPEDLWDIHTMGFRGEALPSIASVSKLSMLTSDGNDSTGVDIEYGKIVKAAPSASANGTDIVVTGLFHKTPARLKHLKSANVELNAILDVMQKFALSHPEISFELYSDDKLRLQTSGNGSLEEVLLNIYGLEVARNSIPFQCNDFDFEVNGVLVLPGISRSNKQYMSVFINGRIVRSYSLQKAISDAYREFLMPDRYPICVLNINVDYQLVDVNVHPSKWEIRLSKEKQLTNLLLLNINNTLKSHFKPAEITMPKEKIKYEEQPLFKPTYTEPLEPSFKEEKSEYVPLRQQEVKREEEKVVIERFQYLAQLHGNYILACDEDNLYIIDQHAAMERCMYEKICDEISQRSFVIQPLLVPLMVELSASEMGQLDKLNEVFATIGVKLEVFSSNSVVIREVPLWFNDINQQQFVRDLIEDIITDKKATSLEIRKDKIATLACHSSIRFNHRLDVMESKNLLSELGKCVQPFNCPHGRPTMMAISEAQLQKEFKRV